MWTRLFLALRVLRGLAGVLPATPQGCARCAELEKQVAYWQRREERTADRLLEAKGLAPVAQTPQPSVPSVMALASRALQMTEIPQTSTADHIAAGPEAMTRGTARH